MFVWTIKSFFDQVQLEGVPRKPHLMKFPNLSQESSLKSHKDFYSDSPMTIENVKDLKEDEIDRLFAPLLTHSFSDIVEQHPKWQILYHFDEIQEQRYKIKPKESSEDKIPFFLFDLKETLGTKDETLIKENLFSSNDLVFNKP